MKVLQILTKGHRKNSLSWWSRTSIKPREDGASLKGLPVPKHTGVWTLARPVYWEETSPCYNEMIAVENAAKQRTILLKSKNILRTSSACNETTFLLGMSSLWISYPSKKKINAFLKLRDFAKETSWNFCLLLPWQSTMGLQRSMASHHGYLMSTHGYKCYSVYLHSNPVSVAAVLL